MLSETNIIDLLGARNLVTPLVSRRAEKAVDQIEETAKPQWQQVFCNLVLSRYNPVFNFGSNGLVSFLYFCTGISTRDPGTAGGGVPAKQIFELGGSGCRDYGQWNVESTMVRSDILYYICI